MKQRFKPDQLASDDRAIYVKLNQTVKRVSEDFERLQFNTSISALMELTRDFEAANVTDDDLNDCVVLKVIQLVAPMAPHLAEEMWETVGMKGSVFRSAWPEYDPDAVVGDTVEIAVQVNGRLRDSIVVEADADQDSVERMALASSRVKAHTEGKTIIKSVFVKGRILNLVVKE